MLDGKYEITSQREETPYSTRFGGTAPDGTAVQIVWYDLHTPDDERAFERYRTLLRNLRRQERAAVYDLVARPGAYYVAWYAPPNTPRLHPATVDPQVLGALEALLGEDGQALGEADFRQEPGSTPKLYGLPFVPRSALAAAPGKPPPAEPRSPAPSLHPPVRGLGRLWQALRPALLGLTFALTGCLLLLLSFYRTVQTGTALVPELRGEEVNRAAAALHALGFAVSPVPLTPLEATPNVGAGRVLELAPPPGTPLRPGRTVSVRYAPPSLVAPGAVPEVRGGTLADAERLLEARGLSVGESARVHADAPLGTVLAQTPAAEAPAPRGGRVALLISDGPKVEETFLPDLTGLPLEDALVLVDLAGFSHEVHLERVQGTGEAADTVLAQNLPPLVAVPQTSVVRLTVSGEAAEVASGGGGTPDLTGLPLAEAQRSARSLGARAQVTEQVSTLDLPEGVVLQRPTPGSPLGERVELTVNVHPEPLPLPTPRASIYRGEVRRARYRWVLEPGIPAQRASVSARTLSGETTLVLQGRTVSGGEQLTGTWLTTAPGPITFTLTLNGLPYGEPVTVNP